MASETSALATVELRHSRDKLHRRLSHEQQRWLADLYRANASAVYFVCQFLLRQPEDAADATQDVFLQAIESLRGRSTDSHARSWLLKAAQEHCLDVLRRHPETGRATPNLVVDAVGSDPESAVVERAVVAAVLGELRARERRALVLWAVERRPLAEIARELGISYTAVQQLLWRARRHAAWVAARVAALLGLLRLTRALRSHAYQAVLVGAVVPVLLASMPSSSSPSPLFPSPPTQSAPLSRVPTVTASAVNRSTATVPGGTVGLTGAPVSLPALPLEADTTALDRAASTLERSVRKLTETIGTGSGTHGVLPGQLPATVATP